MDAADAPQRKAHQDGSGTPTTASRRRRRVWMVSIAVLVAVLGVAGLIWATHARVLADGGGGVYGGSTAPGETWYVDLGIYPRLAPGDSVDIDLHSIRPRITLNTAGATVDILACAQKGPERVGAIKDNCSTLTPWRSGTLTLGPGATSYVILAGTTAHSGVLRIDGADVTYRDGFRRGSQHVGTTIEFTTP
jgi:hypothetical protein